MKPTPTFKYRPTGKFDHRTSADIFAALGVVVPDMTPEDWLALYKKRPQPATNLMVPADWNALCEKLHRVGPNHLFRLQEIVRIHHLMAERDRAGLPTVEEMQEIYTNGRK